MTNETRRKIVTLANRLTPKMDGDKSAAFIKAWAIVKAGGLELAVKGVSFGNRQEALKRLAAYSPEKIRAVLVPEPTNPIDSAALAVMVGINGGRGLFKVGYIPREITAVVNAINGQLPTLRVVSDSNSVYSKRIFGARVALAV